MLSSNIIPPTFTDVKNGIQWTNAKQASQDAAKAMYRAGIENQRLIGRAARMQHCAEQITVEHDPDTKKSRIARATLCRDRLCPTCNWRLAVKRAAEMHRTVDELYKAYNGRIKGIMLTLTVRNCTVNTLYDTIKRICEGATRLRKLKQWRENILGHCRSIELTYAAKTQTYHPHVHMILIVPDTYRATDIPQKDFANMWKQAARLDYTPIVDVRYAYKPAGSPPSDENADTWVRIPETRESAQQAIVEAVKYAIKPDALNHVLESPELADVAMQMAHHRLIAYGGCVKEARKRLGFTTTADEPMTEITDDEQLTGPTELHRMLYEWSMETSRYIYWRIEMPREGQDEQF